MRFRTSILIASVSLLMAGCLASTFTAGQIIESKNTQGMSLLNDLPKTVNKDQGRFQIVTIVSHTFLLDTASGDTWVLTIDAEDDSVTWVEVPKVPRGKKANPPDPVKPKQPARDPFD